MSEQDLKIEGTNLRRVKSTKEARRLLSSSGPLMFIVYAKWCGHCQNMFETWKDLARQVANKAEVHVIEASNYTDEDISGYPSMRIVKNGKAIEYEGGRSAEELSSALLNKPFGGKRSARRRTRLLVRRVRKTTNRTFRRNIPLI